MYIAPPTVPGIPDANSNPDNDFLVASADNFIKLYPAPTIILLPITSTLLNSSNLIIIPSNVKVLTPELKIITMANKEMKFHYRDSFLQHHKGYICLEAVLKLKPGKRNEISEINNERKKRRLESQPLEYPSAGSVFRNPDGMFAGKMIEDIGLKGLTKGGAQISNKHANFIINIGGATAEDIKDLIEFVQTAVYDNYGVKLKVEQEFVNWE